MALGLCAAPSPSGVIPIAPNGVLLQLSPTVWDQPSQTLSRQEEPDKESVTAGTKWTQITESLSGVWLEETLKIISAHLDPVYLWMNTGQTKNVVVLLMDSTPPYKSRS